VSLAPDSRISGLEYGTHPSRRRAVKIVQFEILDFGFGMGFRPIYQFSSTYLIEIGR
jgi:hypothetical protein